MLWMLFCIGLVQNPNLFFFECADAVKSLYVLTLGVEVMLAPLGFSIVFSYIIFCS